MRIKLDENLLEDMRGELAAAGHDVHTCGDEGMTGFKDEAVLAACRVEGRVLWTSDLDFSDIRRFPPGSSPGVVIFRLSEQELGLYIAAAARLLFHKTEAEMAGNLVIVGDSQIRIKTP